MNRTTEWRLMSVAEILRAVGYRPLTEEEMAEMPEAFQRGYRDVRRSREPDEVKPSESKQGALF